MLNIIKFILHLPKLVLKEEKYDIKKVIYNLCMVELNYHWIAPECSKTECTTFWKKKKKEKKHFGFKISEDQK